MLRLRDRLRFVEHIDQGECTQSYDTHQLDVREEEAMLVRRVRWSDKGSGADKKVCNSWIEVYLCLCQSLDMLQCAREYVHSVGTLSTYHVKENCQPEQT